MTVVIRRTLAVGALLALGLLGCTRAGLSAHLPREDGPRAYSAQSEVTAAALPTEQDTMTAAGSQGPQGGSPSGNPALPAPQGSARSELEIAVAPAPAPALPTVTYCGANLDLFAALYPERFAEAWAGDVQPSCLQGPAPPGAVIHDVPYYNQCSFPTEQGAHDVVNPCRSGCAPTSLMMAFEYAGLGKQDVYALWSELWTGSLSGTQAEHVTLAAQERGIYAGEGVNMAPDEIRSRIDLGEVILVNIKYTDGVSPYIEERFGEYAPPASGHYALIVGYADAGIVMQDPYTTTYDTESFGFGKDLLIRWETLTGSIYRRQNPMIAIAPVDASQQSEGNTR